METPMPTCSLKSFLSSVMPCSQYAQVFSEMSSMLRKEPWPGPNWWPDVVPRTMRGLTFVTMSYVHMDEEL